MAEVSGASGVDRRIPERDVTEYRNKIVEKIKTEPRLRSPVFDFNETIRN